jgi:hypothetical protein
LLPLLCGTKSDFLREALLPGGTKLPDWQSLERTVQINSLRGDHPQAVSVPQLLRETSGIQPHKIVQKDCTNEGTSPDADGVNYASPLKVTKAERF